MERNPPSEDRGPLVRTQSSSLRILSVPRPAPGTPDRVARMRELYWRLGRNKWKEVIEEHGFGPRVFDDGLHGRSKEEKYLEGVERGFTFISDHLGVPTDEAMVLRLHAVVCAHFVEDPPDDTAFRSAERKEYIGVFRDERVVICWIPSKKKYPLDERARIEYEARGFGSFGTTDEGAPVMLYASASQERTATIFRRFLGEYHEQIRNAETQDDRLRAITNFYRDCEWLHPFMDGTGRVDLLLLGKHLVENGFSPCLTTRPFLSSVAAADVWLTEVRMGMKAWSDAVMRGTIEELRREAATGGRE